MLATSISLSLPTRHQQMSSIDLNQNKHIHDLKNDELIYIFQYLPFKQQISLIPKVCKKWYQVANMIPFVKNARLLACDLYYNIIKKLGIIPFWMQFQEKILFKNEYFHKYYNKYSKNYKLAIKVCHQLLHWKFDNFKTLIYFDIENNLITNQKMSFLPVFRNMTKIIIGESYFFNDLSVFNSLKKLKYLEIVSALSLKSVSALKSNLETLYLKNCQGVTDVSPFIVNCPKIINMGINDCYCFEDISYFYKFQNLEILSLDRCKNIKKIRFLSKCPKLKKLYLYQCQEEDPNIGDLINDLYWLDILNYPMDLDY